MKVLGIYTYESFFPNKICKFPLQTYQDIPIGFTAILTEIEKSGNIVETLVCSQYTCIKAVFKRSFLLKYDLICFTVVSSQIRYVCNIAKKIKQINKNIKIIVGGTAASLFTEYFEKQNVFDAICIGDGLETIKIYLQYLDNKVHVNNVPGFWIKENAIMIKNKKSKFSDLKNFPIINRLMWDKWIFDKSSHSVLISRGCVNSCSYCSNHALKNKNEGIYVSFRNIKDIIKEIEKINYEYPNLSILHLESESFSINLKFAYQLFDMLKVFNHKISFSINLHLTKELEKNIDSFTIALKKANINSIYVGLESGSYKIRNNILRRPYYSNNDFIKVCKYLNKYNILVSVAVLLGLPTETEKNIKQTISILNKIKPARVRQSIFTPYPGTDIYSAMINKGIVKSNSVINNFRERDIARLNYPNLSATTIQKYYDILNLTNIERRKIFIKKNFE